MIITLKGADFSGSNINPKLTLALTFSKGQWGAAGVQSSSNRAVCNVIKEVIDTNVKSITIIFDSSRYAANYFIRDTTSNGSIYTPNVWDESGALSINMSKFNDSRVGAVLVQLKNIDNSSITDSNIADMSENVYLQLSY